MTKAEATKAIRDKIHEREGVRPTVLWSEWGNTQFPSGICGQYGRGVLSATGYKRARFVFAVSNGGMWIVDTFPID